MDYVLDQVTLAILAGGEGSRMGRPKGLLEIGGKPILAYLMEKLRWPGPTLLVTGPGREKPPGSELFSREVVDAVAGEGPLRGVLTALEGCSTSIVVVATVDMPGIGAQQLVWLIGELKVWEDAMGVMCLRTSGRLEPFPAAFRGEAVELVRRRLAGNDRSVHSLAEDQAIVALRCPRDWPESVWTNLNRPEDVRVWESASKPPPIRLDLHD